MGHDFCFPWRSEQQIPLYFIYLPRLHTTAMGTAGNGSQEERLDMDIITYKSYYKKWGNTSNTFSSKWMKIELTTPQSHLHMTW